jgi:hypothetical protein
VIEIERNTSLVSRWWKRGTAILTSDEFEAEEYPTEWRLLDEHFNIECRQLSLDTYQLRNELSVLTVNKEGFNLYRDGSFQGAIVFNDWLKRNNINIEPRDDVAEGTDGA